MGRLHTTALFLLLATTVSVQADPSLSPLPSVEARSLAKEQLGLPQDLQGQKNLVVISFERSQSDDLATWSETLTTVRGEREDVDSYVLLVMGDLPRALRVVIETAMRGQIKDDEGRERFLLMYGDRDAFVADMGIDDTSSLLVVVLDAAGRPLWQARGPRTDEAVAGLTGALATP